MKKRILCLLLVIVTILSNLWVNVSASTSLSEDSAKKFLRFLSGSPTYTPKSDNAFYKLLTGKTNDTVIKESFVLLVYKTIDENWYERRLTGLENSLTDYVYDELSKTPWELLKEVYIDDSGLPYVDLDDIRAVFECVAGFFNMRNSNRAKYFNAMIGIDPNDEFFDIISEANALSCGISQSDKNLIDEWTRYVRSIDNIKTSTTTNIQTQSPNTGGSSNYSCKITFDSNCNDVSDYIYTFYSEQNNWHVPTMTRSGYIFCGWFYDSACTQSATGAVTLDSDKTFYAKWIKRDLVITLNSNCTSVPNQTIHVDLLDNASVNLPSLTRAGYFFGGWFYDRACTNKVSTSLSTKNDVVLYAKWTSQFSFTNNNGNITIKTLEYHEMNNGNPVGDIVIPASIDGVPVTEIAASCFSNNTAITSVVIPNSVKKINAYAFYDCKNLQKIYMGSGIIEVGNYAFTSNPNVKSVYIDDIVSWCNINFATSGSNPLCSGAKLYVKGEFFEYLDTKLEGITSLGNYAFYGYEHLKSVNISSDVKNIGVLAFGWCENLEKVVFADGLTYIGDAAFENCNKLTQVVLPQTLTKISYGLFCFCENLKEISIPSNVTEIGDSAFHHCASLETITFPQKLEKIGERAFEMCHNIQQINFNDGLKEIGEGAFASCFSLENVELPGTLKVLPRDLFIMDHSICDCDIKHLSSLKNVVLNEGVEEIGYGSFRMCRNLTNISLPDSLKTIGYSAFTYCKALKTIDLPESLQTISGQAFASCESLESLHIPKNVATIGPRALMHCDSLSNIDVDKENAAFMCENGVLYDKEKTRLLRCFNMNDKMFEIPDTIKYIEECAFQTCENTNKVIMPDGIDKIPDSVFWLCKSLKTIVIPKSITKIESYALSNTSLEKIYYEGSKEDWNKVTIDATAGENYCNYFILGIPKYYNCIYSSEQTQICDDNSTITAYVEPSEEYINNKVIFSLYKDSIMVDVEIKDFINTQEPLVFSSGKKYDMAKIMIWNNMADIVPQRPAEIMTKIITTRPTGGLL